MINEHAVEWLGYPVKLYDPKLGMPDYRNTVFRMAWDFDEDKPLAELFAQFLDDPRSRETPAIIFGLFGEHDDTSSPLVEALVAARKRLPNLKGIFLGDIISEENEISWIQQSDVSPIFEAYPALGHFRIRGGSNLSLGGRIEHARLKSLVIESGGLDADVVRDVCRSHLPELEHLELWLGSEEYGGNATLENLEPIFSGQHFPKLKRLGLRDSEIQDEIAIALARAPITARLETLDLSLGTLSDEGAAALLSSDAVLGLKKLDLHHHYLSDEMMARLKATGLNMDLSERQEPDKYRGEEQRYIAVSE